MAGGLAPQCPRPTTQHLVPCCVRVPSAEISRAASCMSNVDDGRIHRPMALMASLGLDVLQTAVRRCRRQTSQYLSASPHGT